MSDRTDDSTEKKAESKPIDDRSTNHNSSHEAADEPETGNKQSEDPPKASANRSFEAMADAGSIGIVREFIDFLKNNKKWWLTPIILVLLLVGVMIALTTSGAAPFLYTFW